MLCKVDGSRTVADRPCDSSVSDGLNGVVSCALALLDSDESELLEAEDKEQD